MARLMWIKIHMELECLRLEFLKENQKIWPSLTNNFLLSLNLCLVPYPISLTPISKPMNSPLSHQSGTRVCKRVCVLCEIVVLQVSFSPIRYPMGLLLVWGRNSNPKLSFFFLYKVAAKPPSQKAYNDVTKVWKSHQSV